MFVWQTACAVLLVRINCRSTDLYHFLNSEQVVGVSLGWSSQLETVSCGSWAAGSLGLWLAARQPLRWTSNQSELCHARITQAVEDKLSTSDMFFIAFHKTSVVDDTVHCKRGSLLIMFSFLCKKKWKKKIFLQKKKSFFRNKPKCNAVEWELSDNVRVDQN